MSKEITQTQYQRNIIRIINKLFAYKNVCIGTEQMCIPMTGKEIGLNAYDLFSLYQFFSKIAEMEDCLENADSGKTYCSIDKIAEYLKKQGVIFSEELLELHLEKNV